jgi:hypothetical protein
MKELNRDEAKIAVVSGEIQGNSRSFTNPKELQTRLKPTIKKLLNLPQTNLPRH